MLTIQDFGIILAVGLVAQVLCCLGLLNRLTASVLGVFLATRLSPELTNHRSLVISIIYCMCCVAAVYLECSEASPEAELSYTAEPSLIIQRNFRQFANATTSRGLAIGAGIALGHAFPAAPVQLPWLFVCLLFISGGFLFALNNVETSSANHAVNLFTVLCCVGVLNSLVTHLIAPESGAIGTILGLSLANLLNISKAKAPALHNALQHEADAGLLLVEQGPEAGFILIDRAPKYLLSIFTSWISPGISPSLSGRIFAGPATQVFYSDLDAVLEGWTIGTLAFNGVFTGKTMLGELLKASGSLPAHNLLYITTFTLALSPFIPCIFYSLSPKPSPKTHKTLQRLTAVPLVCSALFLLGVIPTLSFTLLGIIYCYAIPSPYMRPFILTFIRFG